VGAVALASFTSLGIAGAALAVGGDAAPTQVPPERCVTTTTTVGETTTTVGETTTTLGGAPAGVVAAPAVANDECVPRCRWFEENAANAPTPLEAIPARWVLARDDRAAERTVRRRSGCRR
jgi:hypothetical protein